MPLYAGKYAICAFSQNMRNMLRSHDRYKPVSLDKGDDDDIDVEVTDFRFHFCFPFRAIFFSFDLVFFSTFSLTGIYVFISKLVDHCFRDVK